MYITKEQLEQRLNKTELQVVERTRSVRGKENRLTHDDRVIIGTLAGEDSQKNIAELVGTSPQTVSNSSRGLTSPTLGLDKDLVRDINERKAAKTESIKDALISNLSNALAQVNVNLDQTDATEASKIAVDMSKILERINGESGGGGKNRTAIIINVPAMREEKSYAAITV